MHRIMYAWISFAPCNICCTTQQRKDIVVRESKLFNVNFDMIDYKLISYSQTWQILFSSWKYHSMLILH